MKQYLSFISLKSPAVLTVLLSAMLTVSCDNREALNNNDNNNVLTLASLKDSPMMRASAENFWNGDEKVQVSIDNGPAVTFTADPNGNLTPVTPILLQSSSQDISARAWYPASWTFPFDQSGGLQPADFIFASTVTGITISNYADYPLVFRHRTAKVTVNLAAGTDISSLTGATVAFYGYTSGVADTSDAGDGVITGSGNDWITPQNSGGNTYTALLIPRDMTGIPFVKVTLEGADYFYTPSAGEADLQQGLAYTYNITVHRTRLEVKVVVENGIDWNDGDEYDVIPSPQ